MAGVDLFLYVERQQMTFLVWCIALATARSAAMARDSATGLVLYFCVLAWGIGVVLWEISRAISGAFS